MPSAARIRGLPLPQGVPSRFCCPRIQPTAAAAIAEIASGVRGLRMGLVARREFSVAVAAVTRSTRASASVSAASAARGALATLSKWRQGNTPHARREEVG